MVQRNMQRNMQRNPAPDFVNWHQEICANDAHSVGLLRGPARWRVNQFGRRHGHGRFLHPLTAVDQDSTYDHVAERHPDAAVIALPRTAAEDVEDDLQVEYNHLAGPINLVIQDQA
jgi:hypothetical protein